MATSIKTQPLLRVKIPLFVVGIALALIAFVAMFWVGTVYSNQSQGPQIPVVVAASDIQVRTPITPDMVAVRNLPANSVPTNAFASVGALTGYSAVVTIVKGQPISSNLVTRQPDLINPATAAYLPIPQGFVALTLPTSEQQGVAGYVAQGDYIDVIATLNSGLFQTDNPHMVTRTIFNQLHVIRVGPPSDAPKQGQAQGVSSSVTVVLSLCDAQYMEWLLINASLKYTLLSYHDYGPASNPPAPSCPSTVAPAPIGPAQIDARWGFTKV